MKRCPKLTENQKKELSAFIEETADTKEVRRAQAVLLIDEQAPYSSITKVTRFKERAVLVFRQRYLKNGLKGIENKRKGRPKGLLTTSQRAEVLEILTKQTPRHYGYEEDYWTTSLLGHLIQKKYRVVYKSKKPYYLLFEEANMSFHKPGKVYEKRDEVKVAEWKEQVKPLLKEAFENPDTIILCEDEMILSTQTTFQKIWLKKGDYPKIEVSNTKRNKSIYGFLTIKTGQCHAFMADKQTMHGSKEMLQEIRKIYPHQKILLFWDGAGWHRGSVVQEFIAEDGAIKVVYFPPYSPEENPQEHVWKQGRSAVTHNTFIPEIDRAAQQFTDHLNSHFFPYKLIGFGARS